MVVVVVMVVVVALAVVVVLVVVGIVEVVVVVKGLMCFGGDNRGLEAGVLNDCEVVPVLAPGYLQPTLTVSFWIWSCWKGGVVGDVREPRTRCA